MKSPGCSEHLASFVAGVAGGQIPVSGGQVEEVYSKRRRDLWLCLPVSLVPWWVSVGETAQTEPLWDSVEVRLSPSAH